MVLIKIGVVQYLIIKYDIYAYILCINCFVKLDNHYIKFDTTLKNIFVTIMTKKNLRQPVNF